MSAPEGTVLARRGTRAPFGRRARPVATAGGNGTSTRVALPLRGDGGRDVSAEGVRVEVGSGATVTAARGCTVVTVELAAEHGLP